MARHFTRWTAATAKRAAALASGLALALGAAGDAAAQDVCRGGAPADLAQRIVCQEISGGANIVIRASDLDIATSGTYARGRGVLARRVRDGGAVDVDIDGGAIATSGEGASGVYVWHSGAAGAVGIDLNDAVVTTSGAYARGVWGIVSHPNNEAPLTVAVTGGAVTAEGRDVEAGVSAHHGGRGSIALTVGAGAEIRAPFSIGAEGRLTRDHASPDGGRLVVSHGGTIEARDAGILAWAAVRSGHTFGAGAQHADDAARTEPMVHVTSSGDVTVGGAATDAFIRAAIAGADGALSAGEKAVYAAILAEDSDALGTALAALPAADYDAAWRARASALSMNRGHEPTHPAEEILGLTRSGIRALALPLDIVVAWVREGAEGASTLSAAERTVLAAVLTGGDLEAALAALPMRAGYDYDYDDNWKNEMREWAASYNAGDIRVDVTGGTIAAEGDGVDARYALTHDRNGAIAVTVAAGATVSGGRHGVHAGGAGLAEGNDGLRDQTVTVDGAVTGGTGAGVRLAGGGKVTVGATGRVGAASGDGVLSDGAGDLVVTAHGAVEGDVRATGGGALTVDVKEGGAIAGTVHDPVGPLTLHGGVGRLLYGAGGAVTVARTGRITGVAGETDAIRSVSGDLSVTVAGSVAGDIRATGGALTLSVTDGGAVTGTVHDPSGPLTVHGSVGRLLYSGGATVTVAESGRLTGVEAGGAREAIRGGGGALDLTVAGRIAGLTDLTRTAAGNLFTIRDGFVDGAVRFGAGDDHMRIEGRGFVSGDIDFGAGTDTLTLDVRGPGEATGFGGSIDGLEYMFKRGDGVARVLDVAFSGSALVLEDGVLSVAGHLNLGADGVLTVHDGSRLVIEVGDVAVDAAAHGRITAGGGIVYLGLPEETTPELHILVSADAEAKREAIGAALQDEEAIPVLGEDTDVKAGRTDAGSEPVTVQAVLKTTGADGEARDAGVLSDDGKAEVRLAPNQVLGVAESPARAPEAMGGDGTGTPAPEATGDDGAGTPAPEAAGGDGARTPAPPGAGGGSGGGLLVVGGGALLAALLFALLDGDEAAFAEWETEESRRRTIVSSAGLDAGHFEEIRVRTGGLERWTRVFAGGAPSMAGGAGGEVRGVALGMDARLARGFHLGVSAMPALAVSSRAGAAPGFDTGLLGGWYAVRGGWDAGALFAGVSLSHGDYRVDTVLANPAAGGAMGGAFDLVQNHARARAGARLDLGGGLRATPSAALFAGALRQGAWTARLGALRAEAPAISQRYKGWKARLDVAPRGWRKGPAGLRWRPGAHLSVARAFTRGPAWVEVAQSDAAGVLGFASRARVRELPRTAHAFGASLTVARSDRWRFRAGYAGMTVDGEPVHAAAARLRMRF